MPETDIDSMTHVFQSIFCDTSVCLAAGKYSDAWSAVGVTSLAAADFIAVVLFLCYQLAGGMSMRISSTASCRPVAHGNGH